MIFVFFLLILFLSTEIFAENCDSPFIAVPGLFHKEDDKNHCKFNPLIHISTDDRAAIDYFEAQHSTPLDSFSILPRGFYDTKNGIKSLYPVLPYLNGVQKEDRFRSHWQIVSKVGASYYFSNKTGNFIPNAGGRIFDKGSTMIMSQSGNAVFLDSWAFYWELEEKNTFDSAASIRSTDVGFRRFYAKLKMWKFSIMGGKDTIHLGPGESGMLISSNAEPFYMVKIQNEQTIHLGGNWNFLFFNGWLREERETASNPQLLAIRLTYRPPKMFSFFELGMTRSMMYGGEGRPDYILTDYPYLIAGASDNVPRSKWDADSYAAVDFTFNIPMYKLNPAIKVFKFYIQESGTDIKAIWQVEDKMEILLPYIFCRFLERAYLAGIFAATEKDIMRLEYTKTSLSHYRHHLYTDKGFSYHGLSLGHPFGRNHQAIRFNHRHYFSPSFSFKWELGYYQLDCATKQDKNKKYTAIYPFFSLRDGLVRRGYATVWLDWIFYGHLIRGYVSVDAGPKSDDDVSPINVKASDKATADLLTGVSVILKF